MKIEEMEAVAEAVLFVSGREVRLSELADVLKMDKSKKGESVL